MSALIPLRRGLHAVPLETVDVAALPACRKRLDAAQRRWIATSGFTARPGSTLLLPGEDGRLVRVLVGVDRTDSLWALGGLAHSLPEDNNYQLSEYGVLEDCRSAVLGFALGAYRFNRYRKPARAPARLAVAPSLAKELQPLIDAVTGVRDLVNTPTEDLGPAELTAAVRSLGKAHGARLREWVGDDLLKHGFPAIHAVGRASHRAPRLIELRWGKLTHPHLVIVGKGVCFDTGGLDVKSAEGMRWMKKDMGGAAHALALAGLIMQAGLPVRLSLLVPAVENSISGNALRPGEVITTRAGHVVEIDNTDAEGRLILCDALAYASEQKPDLIVDFATLTGAARVALGPDLPALFGNERAPVDAVLEAARSENDPLWSLPLWRPYRRMLDSYLADFANSGTSRHAGAITAALYLERFVPSEMPWLHVDVYAWNDDERPGRPKGGEAQGLRAFFRFLVQRYSA